jgi:lipopolysaccharide transport system permease protein
LFAPVIAPATWLFPFGMAALILLGFSLGLLAAPFGLLYDDVHRLLFTGAGFLFFLTPVVYPLPAGHWFQINPVAVLITTTRGWITGASAGPGFIIVTALSLVVLTFSWLLYRLARPHFVARLG